MAGSLSDFDITALGSSGNLVRARLPADPALLHQIAALPEVDGLGGGPPERKLTETFVRKVSEALPQEQAPVFITLMADDPDSRWRNALEDLGAVVDRFDPGGEQLVRRKAGDAAGALQHRRERPPGDVGSSKIGQRSGHNHLR